MSSLPRWSIRGRRNARRKTALHLLLLWFLQLGAAPVAAAPVQEECCTGICEDGCCFLSEEQRRRLHRERRERPEVFRKLLELRSKRPVVSARSACPEDCCELPLGQASPAVLVASRDRVRVVSGGHLLRPTVDQLPPCERWDPAAPRAPPSS